jgi:hypothetical protein
MPAVPYYRGRPASGSRSCQPPRGQQQRTRPSPHPWPARDPPRQPRSEDTRGNQLPVATAASISTWQARASSFAVTDGTVSRRAHRAVLFHCWAKRACGGVWRLPPPCLPQSADLRGLRQKELGCDRFRGSKGTANAVWVHAHPGFKSPSLRF